VHPLRRLHEYLPRLSPDRRPRLRLGHPGPIGAILTPQLMRMQHAQSLPYASSLCGACYEVCPVKINIPEVLLDLRAQVTDQERGQFRRFLDPMYLGLRIANLIFSEPGLFHAAQFFGRIGLRFFTRKDGWIHSLPSLAPNGPRPATCAACPARPSTAGGRHAAASR